MQIFPRYRNQFSQVQGRVLGLPRRRTGYSVSPSAVALVDDLARSVEADIAAGDRHPDAFAPARDLAGQQRGECRGAAWLRDELDALEEKAHRARAPRVESRSRSRPWLGSGF